jgi:hypothetical protein
MTKPAMEKRLAVKTGILAALVLILGISRLAGPRGTAGFDAALADYLDPDIAYRQLVLSGDGGELVFTRDGERWLISSAVVTDVARNARVEEFLESLFSLRFTRLVSRDGFDDPVFGLTGPGSVVLSFYDEQGRLITGLHFGAVAGETSEQYFAFGGERDVYAIPTEIGFYLGQSGVYWTELRVWNADALSVNDVREFRRDWSDGLSERWQAEGSGGWLGVSGERTDRDIDAIVRSFIRIEGQAIVGSAAQLPESATQVFTLSLTVNDGRQLALEMYRDGSADDVRYLALPVQGPDFRSPGGQSRLYQIPEWRFMPYLDL